MRLIRKGTFRKVTLTAILAVFLYTIFTIYYGPHDDILNLTKPAYSKEDSIVKHQFIRVPIDSNSLKHTSKRQLVLTFNNSSDISEAYRKRWIGFPEMYGRDCPTALKTKVNNSIFPSKVKRTYPVDIIADASDCKSFIEKYGFSRYPAASQEELDFPLAFIILFYTDIDQILFLLRSLYHQHNVYCLSVDIKSSVELLEALRSVTKCLPNVFVASKLEHIVYAGFSRLQSDINCMEDLLKHPVQWKYAINLPGQEFPLRTNLEMVRILQKYNGANDIEGLTGNRMLSGRYLFKHEYITDEQTGTIRLVRTEKKHQPPPHNLSVVKGSAYGTFSREFVQFVIDSPVAKDLLQWTKEINSPDEYFWATLHHSNAVAVPGGYTAGKPDLKPWLTAYASWAGTDPCATIHTHSICIFTPSDLPDLMKRYELFANKFYITHHPAALHCLDEHLFNLTFTRSTRNLTYYNSLPFALKVN